MTRSMRWTVPILGLLAVASVLLVYLNPPEIRNHHPGPSYVSPKLGSALARLRARVGSTAPELTFRSISDESVHRLSEFRGRVVLLNIWVTGCGPCWTEMPALNALQKLHGPDRLAVITLAPQRRERVQAAAVKRGVTLPPLSGYSKGMSWVPDTEGPQTQPLTVLIDGWIPSMAWPLTILIDATGKIREVTLGWQSEQQLETALRDYL